MKVYVILFFCLMDHVYGLELAKNKSKYFTAEYILPCNKTDPNINRCLMGTFNHLRPYVKTGIPEIEVPSLDPLKFEKIEIGEGEERKTFTDTTASGVSNYLVKTVKSDIENNYIELGINIPRLKIRGKYEVGTIIIFPIILRGDFLVTFSGVDATAKIFGKEVLRDGETYMTIDKVFVDFRLQNCRFRIWDIVNQGNIFDEPANLYLNDHSEDIISDIRPTANDAIAEYVKDLLNKAFIKIPLPILRPGA